MLNKKYLAIPLSECTPRGGGTYVQTLRVAANYKLAYELTANQKKAW